jgi:AcrR family transcriptional regulator
MQSDLKDRRLRKTRQGLRQALLDLLKEKRYEDISVQDIIERADVARSTFYAHFMDKDDLLTGQNGIFAENLGKDMAGHSSHNHGEGFSSLTWFQHIQAQGDILKVIAKDPAMDIAMKTLRKLIHQNVLDGLRAHHQSGGKAQVPISLLADYLTDTLMSMVKWWYQNDMTYSPQQMDALFKELVLPGTLAAMRDVDSSGGKD